MPAKTIAIAIMVFLLGTTVCWGGTDDRKDNDSHQSQKKIEDPSMRELLEFLGQWETDDGNWIDPSDIDWLITPNQGSKNDD